MNLSLYTPHGSGLILSEVDSDVSEWDALADCDVEGTSTTRETRSLYRRLGPVLEKRADAVLDAYNIARQADYPDWDGEGGRPVTGRAFRAAVEFVKLLPDDADDPTVSVDPDGSLCFEWADPDGQRVSVSVEPDGRLTFAGFFADEEFCGKGRIDTEIPDSLLTGIRKIQAK